MPIGYFINRISKDKASVYKVYYQKSKIHNDYHNDSGLWSSTEFKRIDNKYYLIPHPGQPLEINVDKYHNLSDNEDFQRFANFSHVHCDGSKFDSTFPYTVMAGDTDNTILRYKAYFLLNMNIKGEPVKVTAKVLSNHFKITNVNWAFVNTLSA
jgi:hypothetical protein